jgi:hypothetical protein
MLRRTVPKLLNPKGGSCVLVTLAICEIVYLCRPSLLHSSKPMRHIVYLLNVGMVKMSAFAWPNCLQKFVLTPGDTLGTCEVGYLREFGLSLKHLLHSSKPHEAHRVLIQVVIVK